MCIRMKYFPRHAGVNHEKIAVMNKALIDKLGWNEKLSSIIATKNRTSAFFIQKSKLHKLNDITCIGSMELNPQKSRQFFNEMNKRLESLRLLHAMTMIEHEVKISFQRSNIPFGSIKIDPY